MNVYCDTSSNSDFIAQTCVSFLSVTDAFAVWSKIFVLFLTRHVISSSGGFWLTFFDYTAQYGGLLLFEIYNILYHFYSLLLYVQALNKQLKHILFFFNIPLRAFKSVTDSNSNWH